MCYCRDKAPFFGYIFLLATLLFLFLKLQARGSHCTMVVFMMGYGWHQRRVGHLSQLLAIVEGTRYDI
ncbi:hypothetical protein BDZ94DRAFT_1275436 [Collybia nuda]|uniref:Uncharacterized protein n=1 Tax=Collybia nuda TaxID=64659 RepID=A0A9P5XTE3_9AGAR|nr:hypothetical protein BDZ94DRAFT_1275436 [Collybia nuda]